MWRKNSWVKAYILLCALCKARVKLKTCGLNVACAGHFVWPLGALKVFNCLIIESMLRSFLTWSIIFLITVKMSLTHWCNDTIADTVPLCLYSWTVNDVSLQVSSTWTWNVSVSLWICVCVCVCEHSCILLHHLQLTAQNQLLSVFTLTEQCPLLPYCCAIQFQSDPVLPN